MADRMKESEAWRSIAREFERAELMSWGDYMTERGAAGLCEAIGILGSLGALRDGVEAQMRDRMATVRGGYGLWYSTRTNEGRDCRVVAACLFAAMAEDDERKARRVSRG